MKKILLLLGIVFLVWYFMGNKEKVKNAPKPVLVIVAFGDSLTAGYGTSAEKSYPAVLAKLTGKTVINAGVSGETAVEAPRRLEQVLAYHPQMVLIEFGANDFMRSMSREAAVSAVATIVERVQSAGAIAVVVDTGGPGMGAYTRDYKKLAKEKQAVFVPGIMRNVFRKREYMSDMVHPNAAGYEIVANQVYQVISPYLSK